MHSIRLVFFYLSVTFLFVFCTGENRRDKEVNDSNDYFQYNNHRTAAEWEPALGTVIVWPLSIPYTLAVELAKDNHLFTMVENEDVQKEAEKWFNAWGIISENVTFIYAPQGIDAWWTRDWGPSAVFTSEGKYMLADGKYPYATPRSDLECNDILEFLYFDENNNIALTQIDDDATLPLANQLGFEILDLPFINTGGNVLTDGLGTAFSTCIIMAENQYHGIDENEFFTLNESLLGFQRYHIISNFEEFGIQHIDCLLKILDEETILVAEPPTDHSLYNVYNSIVADELSKIKTPYGRPYHIKRIKTARYRGELLAAYTNSLILNKTIYVPLFDIPQDTVALNTWAEAMPGYEIKGFTFTLDEEPFVTAELRDHYESYGWRDGDALHCRTRAIWNPEMLFMTIKKIEPHVQAREKIKVHATIIDYSKSGLIENQCVLYWRISDDSGWNRIPLSRTDHEHHFFAEFPKQKSGTTIEYYISAASHSGEKATRPITAPKGIYQFKVE
ncbi:MAG TPA: agmatine deiminase family protein [Saprospiraceae bacterium]|nr:agmatine deiminase family protein [Saprospiraceae bacterium]